MQRLTFLVAIVFVVSGVGAQDFEDHSAPVKSLGGAAGRGQLPDYLFKRDVGMVTCGHDDHHEAKGGRSAGVLIFSTNTVGCEGTELFCTEIDEDFLYREPDFWVKTVVPQSVEFKPHKKYPKYLEIIWTGQINISSGEPGWIRQTVFFGCTVTQKGKTVPCSNTCMDPAISQETTGDGLTQWVTYHGYAEIKPKHDVRVDLRLYASEETRARVCEDTLILKY